MITTTTKNHYLQQTRREEQLLYDHFLTRVKVHEPDELLEDFSQLFIRGREYAYPQVRAALEKIVRSKQAEQTFNLVLNRCCHILINWWQMEPRHQSAIPELIAIFQDSLAPRHGSFSATNRLRLLVYNFTQSDQYHQLQRLAHIIAVRKNKAINVGNLIDRYPYLYDHTLLSEDSSCEHQQTVRQLQASIQFRYELDLSQYVTSKVRKRAGVANRQPETIANANKPRIHLPTSDSPTILIPDPVTQEKLLRKIQNPTLLEERELGRSLKHFVGRVDGRHSYRDISRAFVTHSNQISTYQAFKSDLYEYLVGSLETKYGNKFLFPEKLYQKLHNTLNDFNSHKPNEFLLLRTASQLMNFMIVDSSQRPSHYVFSDLITNLGVPQTIGIFMKLVLLCRKVKPYLEKRISILFNHYESFTKDGVPWLVMSLENIQLALSIFFGKVDLSCLKPLLV